MIMGVVNINSMSINQLGRACVEFVKRDRNFIIVSPIEGAA